MFCCFVVLLFYCFLPSEPSALWAWGSGTRRVFLLFRSPLPGLYLSEFHFSLGRLYSGELFLKLDVFLGHSGLPYQAWRGLLFSIILGTLFLLICNGSGFPFGLHVWCVSMFFASLFRAWILHWFSLIEERMLVSFWIAFWYHFRSRMQPAKPLKK